jgi:thiol-disulfide isomerase/thioredoxin
MTNDMPESPSPAPAPLRRIPYVIGAVVIGAMIGFAGVYGFGGLKRNAPGDSACAGAVNLARKISPLAHGEVAALTMATAPLKLPDLDRLQTKLGGKDFEVVAINIDTRDPEKPKNFLKEARLTRLGYFSDEKAKSFQDLKAVGRALGMPTSVLVDGQGCEIATIAGPAEWDSEDAVKLITAATATGS